MEINFREGYRMFGANVKVQIMRGINGQGSETR
jgi:hypothetical protein